LLFGIEKRKTSATSHASEIRKLLLDINQQHTNVDKALSSIREFSHARTAFFVDSSEENYFNDLDAILDIIENATGERTKLIRFPGASSNTVSKAYNIGIMGRLAEKVNEKGYTYFDWNVSSGDAGETISSKQVFNNIIKGIKEYNVPVVLQHDTKKYSIDAVEDVILWAFEQGYDFDVLTPEHPIVKHKIFN
jgi:peptidoglycan/xylan/chitin deacetylase (PgdA/CDA1 family)